MLRLALLCVLVFTSSCVQAGSLRWDLEKLVNDQRNMELWRHAVQKGFLWDAVSKPSSVFGDPTHEHYFEQPLDHFDVGVTGTYKQRYWVNGQYFTKPDGPVFLYVGGEGGLRGSVVLGGEHMDLAKKYGALVFAVEHRYYGKSLNEDSMELENIVHLSSQQALADLAAFHDFAVDKYGLTETNKWISFGGSYPGALSAWLRIKYPHLVYGAIASSAPVQAVTNFEGYNDVVTASFGDPVVNGSQECVGAIRKAFLEVDAALDQGRYAQLSKMFNTCQPLDPQKKDDIKQFASNLADIFMGTAQYNLITPLNISYICRQMVEASDPLAQLVKETLYTTGKGCLDNSWQGYLQQLRNVTPPYSGVGLRSWIFQTCTQFGYYQTCDVNTTCVFSSRMDLAMNLEICQEVFNISPSQVQAHVRFSNDYYGGNQPRGTRIVFVNGSIDPWHALSVLHDLPGDQTAVYINGTAHCANMGADRPGDSTALLEAREHIDKIIGLWLSEPPMKSADKYVVFNSLKTDGGQDQF